MAVKEKVISPQISMPKGGGAIRGLGETFHPNSFSGTGNFSIPIYTSESRNGEFDLSLDYSSATGNGIFGIGFAVSIPNISRRTDKGIPRYDNSDMFVLSDVGPLAPKLTEGPDDNWAIVQRDVSQEGQTWSVTEYIPQVESQFSRIEQWVSSENGESFWEIQSRENVKTTYGRTENSRIADPNNKSRIFQWLIQEALDPYGNKTIYTYKQENGENVPNEIFEIDRSYTANRYIESIRYGNYVFENEGGETGNRFAFEIVFDYGEYDLNNPDSPPGTWAVRKDPFSTYRAGFEIRTFRLCTNILQFHHFNHEFNDTRFLVRAVSLEYLETPALSFLKSIQEVGYRKEKTGTIINDPYETKRMPPVELDYSPFNPLEQSYGVLSVEGGDSIPGYLSPAQYLSVDLYGEGIPGFLYSNETTTLYWEPEGNGRYSQPAQPQEFPIEQNLQDPEFTLMDIDGNGQLELVVSDFPRGGFYQCNDDKTWKPYRSLEALPMDFSNPEAHLVDLNGNGLSDILLFEGEYVKFYLSEGEAGFGPAHIVNHDRAFPASIDIANGGFRFANMFGDGLSHLVRIRSGIIECWPNLGYGHFGPRVLFGNAPQLGSPLNNDRLFLVDIDGSGTADLLYVLPNRIDVYLNQSGNRFSDPISIHLPAPYDILDQISFADVLGIGAASLIFTTTEPDVRHYYYDFTGGTKPYLLTTIDNNIGVKTCIEYCSSTKFYLEDKKAGRPWVTSLPFPVQVVEKVESVDGVSRSKLVSRYKYHDGYFDPVQKEFRGFGFVERWDTEPFEQFSQPDLIKDIPFEAGDESLHVAPIYVKTWYHTGAYIKAGVLTKQYEAEYFHKDPLAYDLPDSSFDQAIKESDSRTVRAAYSALSGQMIHEEVYGLDGAPEISDNPYTVTETNFYVRLIQPPHGKNAPAFYVYERETIDYDYERNPVDPRIRHDFALEVDEFGNILNSCKVFYPRRTPQTEIVSENPADRIYPEQTALRSITEVDRFINVSGENRWLGISCESKEFELHGLSLPPDRYFSFDEIKTQVDLSLRNQVPYGERFTPGELQARLFSWFRYYYWNADQCCALSLCEQLPQRLLLHHTDEAVFTPELIQEIFGNKVTDNMLSEDGGYIFRDGYWWNPGLTAYYYKDANSFYLPYKNEDTLGGISLFEYDSYFLLPTKESQFVGTTPTGEDIYNVTSALYDYNTLEPEQTTDENNNISQALYDPLGYVTATSIFGMVESNREGDEDLRNYVRRYFATFDEVLANPHYYLQGATAFYFYDPYAWEERSQPLSAIELLRQTHVSDLEPGQQSIIQTRIDYIDGFGRDVEGRMAAEGKYIVFDKTVYNNKSEPVKKYLPYYSLSPYFEDYGSDIPPSVYYYDPILRVIRLDTPKGFFSKAEFSPWVAKGFDEDDTVIDSPYYKEHIHEPGFNPNEKDALEKAAVFFDTPLEQVLDNTDNIFLSTEINVGESAQGGRQLIYLSTHIELDIRGQKLAITDPRLAGQSPALANLTYRYDMTGNVLSTRSVDAGLSLTLNSAYGKPIHTWDARGLHIHNSYDALDRLTQVFVQGQDEDSNLALDQIVQRIEYGETQADSYDKNLRGEVYKYYDEAGTLTIELYNIQNQALATSRKVLEDYTTEVNWDNPNDVRLEPPPYTTLYTYDALSRITSETTPDLSKYTAHYGITGWLKRIEVKFADGQSQTFVEDIEYTAAGLRQVVNYGNEAVCHHFYEETTLNLMVIRTDGPETENNQKNVGGSLQNIEYYYDPVGNVTRTYDYTYQSLFCNPQSVVALSDYRYDALYQLRHATGKQHPGISLDTHINGFKQSIYTPLCPPLSTQESPPDAEPQLQEYAEDYAYDDSGNLTTITHYVPPATEPVWIRIIEIADDSNRAVFEGGHEILYDACGNTLSLEDNLKPIQWNYRNNISSLHVLLQEGANPHEDYFLYDYLGNRVRKVVDYNTGADPHKVDTVYIDNLVTTRIKDAAGITISELQSLRVMDELLCVAVANHRPPDGSREFRYQMIDSLGSSVVEADQAANPISYEEFFPFGGTTVISGNDIDQVKLKDYRYSGKECDDSTGLYYYGQRYYASWMGRWMNPDPAGAIDGLNLYEFVGNNPLTFMDENGEGKTKKKFEVWIEPRPKGGLKLKVKGRPKKFSPVTLRALAKRFPALHTKGGTTLKNPSKYSRNHILPWFLIAKEQRTYTRGFTLPQMIKYLKNDIDTSTFSSVRYKNSFTKLVAKPKLTQSEVEKGFKFIIQDEYQNPDNLHVNLSGPNSSAGSGMKQDHVKLSADFYKPAKSRMKAPERAKIQKSFRKRALDFPTTMPKKQKQEIEQRYEGILGTNPGKFI